MQVDTSIAVDAQALHLAHRFSSDIVGVAFRALAGDMEVQEALTVIGRRATKLVSILSDMECFSK